MRKIVLIAAVLFLSGFILGQAFAQFDFGDAPEGAPAYPAMGVTGAFPTCKNVPLAGWIQHTNFGAWFGPAVDFEAEGNGGICPSFMPYDNDECFADGDAGLMFPPAYTIIGGVEVPCIDPGGTLGVVCQRAVWGANLDIHVHNTMPGHEPYLPAYVNVLMDWDQNGSWGGASTCPLGSAPEHVLVDFIVPPLYIGLLSAIMPAGTGFRIGPNPGYVWTRFTITEVPLGASWIGEGTFEDGESEDYLLRIDPQAEPTMLPVLTECPEVETECPQQQTHCPVESTVCPVISTQCPAQPEVTICPEAATQCPVVETECPTQETVCPLVDTHCPEQQTFCPKVYELCPPEEFTIWPVMATMCPVVFTACPNGPTFCPDPPTACPSASTWCPPVETQCPVEPAYTACPLNPTQCPLEATVCPLNYTLCPDIPTVCPSVVTNCPEIPTQCPQVPTVCATQVPTVCPVDPTYCPLVDSDADGVLDCNDNCPNLYNPGQEDSYPPGGNGCGDACECEGNFDDDYDQDGTDASTFKKDFGRSKISGYPCTGALPCNGDFECDTDVDGTNASTFKVDFGRSKISGNPCPLCPTDPWCVYP